MSKVVVQPSIGNQLATPNDSFLKQFSNISFYNFGLIGLSGLLVLIGIIYMLTNAAMKDNNIDNRDQKNRIEKKKEIEKNEQIALIIFLTGIGLCLIMAVINFFFL